MSKFRRKPMSRKRASKEMERTVRWLADPANMPEHLDRTERREFNNRLDQLEECWNGCRPGREPGCGSSPLNCPATCAFAQRRFERIEAERIFKFLIRQGNNPLMTTVIYPHLDMTPDNLVTFDPNGIEQHLRRGLNRAEHELDRKIVAVGRFEFKQIKERLISVGALELTRFRGHL